MEEYLNYTLIALMIGVLVINIIIDIVEKTKGIFLSIFILGMIGYMFVEANNQFETAKDNMKGFKKEAAFKCYSGGGLYSGADTYRVSRKDGWELDKKYFVKDSISIRVNKCEEW